MRFASKSALIASLILIAVLGAWTHFRFGYSHVDQSGHTFGSDDAFISYRYAWNLVQGNGLVFNPGERVEGYTNLLYTLLAAGFIWLNPDLVLDGCIAINVLAYVCTLLTLYHYLIEVSTPRRALLGLALLCLNPIMWAWPASGLESSVVVLVQLGLFVSAERLTREHTAPRFIGYCALLLLAITLRADGFVFALIFSGVFLLKKRYRLFVASVCVTTLMTLAYFAARYAYYGDILPNTYYAKVTGTLLQRLSAAEDQMISLFWHSAFFLYLAPVPWGLIQFVSRFRKQHRLGLELVPVIPALIFAFAAYWFYVGGDVYYERFLLILIPLTIIFVTTQSTQSLIVLFSLIYLGLQITPYLSDDNRFTYHQERYDRWVALGKFIKNHHPHETLAIDAAGKAPYYSQRPTIDMLGLNNRHIGHQPAAFGIVGHSKYDADYVLSQQPGLIAAWGTPQLDMIWGLSRAKYLASGYELKYMVNATATSKTQDIIDVSSYSTDQITALHQQGYSYYVLRRR